MHRNLSIFFILAMALPIAAMAQSASKAPILVLGEDSPPPAIGSKVTSTQAISNAGEQTGGHVDLPATPATPTAPPNPTAPANPAAPENPATPESPESPISKLWPRDTIQIFMPPCTGLRPQYVKPCLCTITKLMVAMPHDEFLKKSNDGTIEQDERLKTIRQTCATAPQKKE